MDQSRRDFLKKATVLTGAMGLTNMVPDAVQAAMAINADKGTTFYDAEHIVFLMQENRSFDHIFGCMKGVRGFNDPRSKLLPDGDKVWVQKTKEGKAIAPFHLDIQKTKITWQGGLPHDWPDQSAARNHGKYDQWIPQKTEMCMGYFNRQDMPFYYAMADAFTVCDHYFCSSLTGTTPNRLFFWTGNIRPQPDANSVAAVRNSMAESRNNAFVDWSTFPELLEDSGVSWKVYQNEVWTAQLEEETDYWLGNYGDNALEYVKRHNVKLSAYFRKHGYKGTEKGGEPLSADTVNALYQQLSPKQKNLVDKTFTTNIEMADYLKLEPFTFKNDTGAQQTVNIPKEDILHQFRKDVESGNLPAVSWLAAPESFSDHTSSPFYGTWYVSQVLDILTQNPEVWKKTIFILNYDENDGYFDHLPPFVVPSNSTNGKVSPGISIESDFDHIARSPIGLGYRVPMIVASPWSKGGYVNSQVFDHTSTLMFLENFLQKKIGKKIHSPNISTWRRTICGDLTSIFRPYNGEQFPLPDFLKKEHVISDIQNAKNKPEQLAPSPLKTGEIQNINKHSPFSGASDRMPQQEKGTRPACALPYELYADCVVETNKKSLLVKLVAGSNELNTGAPFNVYTKTSYNNETGRTWFYAVEAGAELSDELELLKFRDGIYNICIDGPNGFHREASGGINDPGLTIVCAYKEKGFLIKKPSGDINLLVENKGSESYELTIEDNAYKKPTVSLALPAGKKKKMSISLKEHYGWYDFTIKIAGNETFSRRYAGHVETNKESITDPFMGGVL